jgi:hypothetical protein
LTQTLDVQGFGSESTDALELDYVGDFLTGRLWPKAACQIVEIDGV